MKTAKAWRALKVTKLFQIIAATAAFSVGITACKTQPPAVAVQPEKFVSPKSGRTYRHVLVADNDEQFEKFEIPHLVLGRPSPDNFLGTDRKAAKTSISSGPLTEFADVADLLNRLPATDHQMLSHNPPISKSSNSDRTTEEQQNVRVKLGFIYAVAKESDNDFHVILGTAPDVTPAEFVNVEVSGLPNTGEFRAPLKDVRDKFKAFFGTSISSSGYHKFSANPIPVQVTGSLFYDIDHPPGAVGPEDTKPHTSWEIHPVTEVEFEPGI